MTNNEELRTLAKQVIPDPGCEKATEMYDKIQNNPDEANELTHLLVAAHQDATSDHSPDCFMSRPVH